MKKRNNKTKKYKNYRQYKRGGCGGGTCGLHSGGGKKRCTKKRCNKCKMCGWKKKGGSCGCNKIGGFWNPFTEAQNNVNTLIGKNNVDSNPLTQPTQNLYNDHNKIYV